MPVADSAAARAFAALVGPRGVRVKLRVALPASVGDDGEQLGLASPGFEDREIGRGVFQGTNVLLVPAHIAMLEALGVVIGDEFFRIAGWEALRAGDGVYGFALTLANRSV